MMGPRAVFALILLSAGADPCFAQGTPPAMPSSGNIGTTSFVFGAAKEPTNKEFCLPPGQNLVKVTSVKTGTTSAPAKINVVPNTVRNCISVTATMPVNEVCQKIPKVRFPSITLETECKTINSLVPVTVDYEFVK